MRISDWSSDVCSSDLGASDVLVAEARLDREYPGGPIRGRFAARHGPDGLLLGRFALRTNAATGLEAMLDERSEERRVGNECVSTRRSRWAPSNTKKTYVTQCDQRETITKHTYT